MDVEAGSQIEEVISNANKFISRAKLVKGNSIYSKKDSIIKDQRKIILFEDDNITSPLIKETLKNTGYDLIHLKTEEDFFSKETIDDISLFIVDNKLKNMSGLELIEKIRNNKDYTETPIILLTSMTSQAEIEQGIKFRVTDYILKPFSPLSLIARVNRLIKKIIKI